jgi:hypothetical protein
VCGQYQAPAAFTSGEDPVPLVQEAGWAPEPVWIGAENFAPPGFDSRTFQPLASRYTDYAIPAPRQNRYMHLNAAAAAATRHVYMTSKMS